MLKAQAASEPVKNNKKNNQKAQTLQQTQPSDTNHSDATDNTEPLNDNHDTRSQSLDRNNRNKRENDLLLLKKQIGTRLKNPKLVLEEDRDERLYTELLQCIATDVCFSPNLDKIRQ